MSISFQQMIAEILPEIKEVFPWDAEEMLEQNNDILLVDIREPNEYEGAYIPNAILVPRGILEASCDWGYSDTIPELVKARDKTVIVICRSGNRSALAAHTMQRMGYNDIYSLKTGVKGWNDADLPLVNAEGEEVDPDWAEDFFNEAVRDDQMEPEA